MVQSTLWHSENVSESLSENDIIKLYGRYLSAEGREKKVLANKIKGNVGLADARKLWKRGVVWSVDNEVSAQSGDVISVETYTDGTHAVYVMAYRDGPIENVTVTKAAAYSVAADAQENKIVLANGKEFFFYPNAPLVLIRRGEKGHLETAKYLQRKAGNITVVVLPDEYTGGSQLELLMGGILETCRPNAILVFGDYLSGVFTGEKKVSKNIGQLYEYAGTPLTTLYTKDQIEYLKEEKYKKKTQMLDRPWLVRDNIRSVDRALTISLDTIPKYEVVDKINVGGVNFVDIETTGLTLEDQITKLQVLPEDSDVCQIIEWPSIEQIRETLDKLENTTIVFHNALFDLPLLLYKTGGRVRIEGESTRIYDTMLIAQRRGVYHINSLKYLSTFTNRRGSHVFGSFSDNLYAAEDVFATREVWDMLSSGGLRPIDMYMSNAIPAFVAQYVQGIRFDKERLEATIEDYERQIEEINDRLSAIDPNVEWKSNSQLAKYLVSNGYSLPKTDKGNYKTDEATLGAVDNEAVRLVLELRGLGKTASHFRGLQSKLTEKGRVHILQDLHGTASGRSTMAYIQQMSKTGPDRTMVVSDYENGLVAAVDLSQAELRILAIISGDEQLCDALLSGDVHKATAALVFNKPLEDVTKAERRATKTVVFGTIYGASAKGLSLRGMGEEEELQFIQDRLQSAYPVAMAYLEKVKETATEYQIVTDIFGKSRSLEQDIFYTNVYRAKRQAGNDVVQGPAGQLALILHASIQDCLWECGEDINSRVLFNLHDESVISVAPGEDDIVVDAVRRAFRRLEITKLGNLPMWSKLPLTGNLDFGNSWGALAEETENENILKSVNISTLGAENE